jgi:hypothetical protein
MFRLKVTEYCLIYEAMYLVFKTPPLAATIANIGKDV